MIKETRSIFSLPEIPDTILSLVLIYGIGIIFGLWLYASFEMYKTRTITSKGSIVKINDYFGNQYIKIKLPQKNSAIDNPVLIAGKANVFEANVRVRMKDDMQNILLDTFITAEGAYDGLYAFEKTVDYIPPSSKNIVMEVFEESQKNGKEINKVIIPLVFKNYIDISDWKTHLNSGYGYEIKYPADWELSDSTASAKGTLSEFNIFKSPSYPMERTPQFQITIEDKNQYLKSTDAKELPETNFYLNSYPAFKQPYDIKSGYESYLLEKSGDIVVINVYYDEKRDSNETKLKIKKILSTFKFIEK
ncbi:MAG: Gmad2 immunoglobulin-like domain-containing protein [Minisyncoccia bacterium]